MENSSPVLQPLALARPRGAHRFEAFSLKLARRLTLYQSGDLQQWILLEADPSVETFCERPGYVIIDGRRTLADFWVRYADHDELVIHNDVADDNNAVEKTGGTLDTRGLSIRHVGAPELMTSRVWISNWRSMLPCLIANRRLITRALSESILESLSEPKRLADIEHQFTRGDPVLVRAALFGLLHEGRVSSRELHSEPLCLHTPFVAGETTP